ncbi:MAG: protease modulator HflC [Rhizobiales bacterium 24-66-13]|jgi:membrane protease subunit HflC|uniref:protease modulator HflC n=1 Tax=Roseixanthobacter finlandensis TaxID=3119922 RepID=UPI000BD82DF0|nr:MAG: protease modulator HflC [Azorhizobium sp. 12-66-6]OYY82247.1 MAG: protease modulator HflC [Rhizobiales bacterium 35-66-30]OYZ66538.1 MAG: protease modulator HflC [Rhizobiales bacterium 24-66-13]OZB03543.1 MAG: protease modulator HflC [Rhizobiales bacterium 39-66-18]HQS47750.1 protease modulator HflC [Xanthobacteraceae bacterium]
MKNPVLGGVLAVIAVVVLIGLYSSAFIVNQTQQALVLRLGDPLTPITSPGLHWKIPFIDSVVYLDKRILDLENPSQEVIASDQKRLVVDAFARYRISNPLRFYQAVGSIEAANSRLATVLNSSLRRVLGESTFTSVVRDDREGLMRRIAEQVNREASNFGIVVVDVRIRRADLPEANSQAVFQRMQTERQREAAEIRAQGAEAAQRLRSRAEREATIVVAEATSRGEQLRGQGDAERNAIFADAFGRDPDFFAFYRSMQAYEASLKPGDTRLLISPDSTFFRYFVDPFGNGGRPVPTPAAAAPAAGAAAAPAQPAPAR